MDYANGEYTGSEVKWTKQEKACRQGERPAELALEVDRLGPEGLREPFQVGAGGTDAVIG
jgi:hypothetical protein